MRFRLPSEEQFIVMGADTPIQYLLAFEEETYLLLVACGSWTGGCLHFEHSSLLIFPPISASLSLVLGSSRS